MKFKILGTILSVAIVVGFGFAFLAAFHTQNVVLPKNYESANALSPQKFLPPNAEPTINTSTIIKNRPPATSEILSHDSPPPSATQTFIHVSLAVGSAHYSADVLPNTRLYEAMRAIASSTPSFTFKATYYSGLGYRIDEINGLRAGNGHYWALYVNNDYATVGASTYKLLNNDSVEWKFEQ